MNEIETKLDVHPAFAMPDLSDAAPGTEAVDGGERDVRSTYWDTEDLRLARASITLRSRRQDGKNQGWQLKTMLPGGTSGVARFERSIPGHPSRPPREAVDRVAVFTRGAPLVPVAKLHTRRGVVELRREGELVAEVVDDEVAVVHGGRVSTRFREVEVELGEAGSEQALRSIVGTLLAQGASRSDQSPKVYTALGVEAEEPDDLDAVVEDPDRRPLATLLADRLRRLRVLDPGVREGETATLAELADVLADLDLTLALAGVRSTAFGRTAAQCRRVAAAAHALEVLDDAIGAVVGAVSAEQAGAALGEDRDRLAEALGELRGTEHAALVGLLRGADYLDAVDAAVAAVTGADRGASVAADARLEGSVTALRTSSLRQLWEELTQRPRARAGAFSLAVELMSHADIPTKKLTARAAAVAEVARRHARAQTALDLLAVLAVDLNRNGRLAAGILAAALTRTLGATADELDAALGELAGKRLRKIADEAVPLPAAGAEPVGTA